jgi:hypothetical protein
MIHLCGSYKYQVRELSSKKVLMLCAGDGGGRKNRVRE